MANLNRMLGERRKGTRARRSYLRRQWFQYTRTARLRGPRYVQVLDYQTWQREIYYAHP